MAITVIIELLLSTGQAYFKASGREIVVISLNDAKWQNSNVDWTVTVVWTGLRPTFNFGCFLDVLHFIQNTSQFFYVFINFLPFTEPANCLNVYEAIRWTALAGTRTAVVWTAWKWKNDAGTSLSCTFVEVLKLEWFWMNVLEHVFFQFRMLIYEICWRFYIYMYKTV